MSRKSPYGITIDGNVRCERIYPTEDTKKTISDLKTVGLLFTKDQAIHLARVLLAVSQNWKEIELTAYRKEKRTSDGTYHITVTNPPS